MAASILAVGRIVDGVTHWRVAPPVIIVTREDVDAAAHYGFDDNLPSLGLVFTDMTEGSIEDDAEFNRWGGA